MHKTSTSIIIGLTMLNAVWAGDVPQRPADFRPFAYQLSTEQLAEKYSAEQMKRAELEWKAIQDVNSKGPWKPTWESLDRHKAPEWFLDGKLGVMINWGLHAVPAWGAPKPKGGPVYPDAYGCRMYANGAFKDHHAKFWGADFQWDDFFPMFKAESYDPEGWAKLLAESGVRYLVPFSKHHDGIAWWDSQWTRRDTVQMGPEKDLLRPLMAAARKQHLKIGMYFCWEEYATAVLGTNNKPCLRTWTWPSGERSLHPLDAANRRRVSGNIPVSDYYKQYMGPLVKEMIDKFDPDCLWMDGEWQTPTETLQSRELIAYYYNRVNGRKDVYVNDRYGKSTRNNHGDVFGSEYHSTSSLTHPWEECRGISQSFAYNYEDNEQSLGPTDKLLHMFIDIVSKNGNLNLIIGPDSAGRIPEPVVRRLKEVGAWLKVNGEAIYGTRILAPYHEGNVSYTRSKDGKYAYAICKEWPGRRLTLQGVRAEERAEVTMLGVTKPLVWQQTEQGLNITIPDNLQDEKSRPCQYAWAIRIPMQTKNTVRGQGR